MGRIQFCSYACSGLGRESSGRDRDPGIFVSPSFAQVRFQGVRLTERLCVLPKDIGTSLGSHGDWRVPSTRSCAGQVVPCHMTKLGGQDPAKAAHLARKTHFDLSNLTAVRILLASVCLYLYQCLFFYPVVLSEASCTPTHKRSCTVHSRYLLKTYQVLSSVLSWLYLQEKVLVPSAVWLPSLMF